MKPCGNPGGPSSKAKYYLVTDSEQVLFEFSGISPELAAEAFRTASHKLPVKVRIVSREGMGGEN